MGRVALKRPTKQRKSKMRNQTEAKLLGLKAITPSFGAKLYSSKGKLRLTTVGKAYGADSLEEGTRSQAVILRSEADLDLLIEALESFRPAVQKSLAPSKKGKKKKKGAKVVRRRDGETKEVDPSTELKVLVKSVKLSSRQSMEAFLSNPAVKPFCKKGFKAVKKGKVGGAEGLEKLKAWSREAKEAILAS